MKTKILATLLTLVMLPGMSMTAWADDGDLIGGIPPANGGTVYVNGIKWRVIGMSDTAWLLQSADALGGQMYWYDALAHCNTVYDAFSAPEKAAVLATNKETYLETHIEPLMRFGYISGYGSDPEAMLLENENLFLLSSSEVATYFNLVGEWSRIGHEYWWTRTRTKEVASLPPNVPRLSVDYGGVVEDGKLSFDIVFSTSATIAPVEENGCQPAFQLSLAPILFTSPAEGAKSTATAGSGAFGTLNDPAGNAKLTLLDENRPAVTASVAGASSATAIPGSSLTVTYSGVTSSDALSALICDENGSFLYYANLTPDASGSGIWNMTLPDDLGFGKSYTLRLFSEQCNGDFNTDYAGAPCDLTLTTPAPYDLWLGDTQVNPGNQDNILNAIDPVTNLPTAAYDPTTKTLTLNNPTISGEYKEYKIYSLESLTVEGKATISGNKGISVISEQTELNTLTIQDAELDISAEWEAIYAKNTHVIMNSGTVNAASEKHRTINVQVHSSFTMNGGELTVETASASTGALVVWRGNGQTHIDGEDNIIINGGRISAQATGGKPISADGDITLPASYYAHLEGSDTPLSLNSGKNSFVDESGEEITNGRIIIEPKPITKYDLWVGDTQVDENNKDDIPSVIGENAKASFDPATNTLTLENVTGVTGSTVGALITAEGIDLTVEGDAVLSDNTVAMGIQVAPGSLTLNGDFTISAESYGVYVQKDVTVTGGTVVAKGSAFGIYSARGDILVKCGTVEASGSMWALYPNPELSGYNPTPYVIVSENVYGSGSAAWNGTDALGGSSSTYKYVKISPLIVLLDDDSNEENKNYMRIQANLGDQVGNVNVRIKGRTLYKTGHWNTLMLPFGLSSFDGTPLEGADVRELVPDECAYSNGTLTLKFAPVTEIQPNVPYIVRWAAAEDIVNPVFENVYLEDGIRVLDLFEGGILFYGTYDPFTVEYDYRKEFLYMGGDSKLYYPKNGITINAFRAFFQLRDFVAGEPSGTGSAKGIGEFVLDFGDETTSLNEELRMKSEESVGDWYSIDGRRLQGKPTAKGVYIYKGKKVIK